MNTESVKRQIRVLHLEDNEQDHFLVAELLRVNGLNCEFTVAKSQGDFTNALKGKYDLIISDFSLPSYDGVSALSLAQAVQPETPFIFFSGTIGEEVAVDSLQNGATDYVLKQRPTRLLAAIHRALRNSDEHARLHQAEEVIREQGALLDKAQDAIVVCNIDRTIMYWNQGAERVYGWTAAEVLGKNIRELLFHGDPPPQIDEAVKSMDERGEWTGEIPEFTKDGRAVVVEARATLIRDEHNHPKSLLIISTDITERKKLEEQFFRAQRLESLGVLVSGIAHDLNNALSPILIGVNILRSESAPKEMESILNTMEASAQRGADMVKQVLAFARGNDGRKTLIHAGQIVREMGKIITNTFPKNINCIQRVEKESWRISGFPTQLHQVLMNLCVNARDAMPEGGTLTLTAENVCLDATMVACHPDARPGNYFCISVADTGTGISVEQMGKIFQPFFTTKEHGKGTGLGLSTSTTIIKNHGGFITVYSEINRGSEFKVYLPADTEFATQEKVTTRQLLPAGNGECILIVDDEEAILAITRAALESYGYRVVTATSGPEAIVRFAEKSDAIQLVMTDLDMPFMDGYATIGALRKIAPHVKIIIATGSELEKASMAQHGITTNGFIHKPFTTEKLLTTLHNVLAKK